MDFIKKTLQLIFIIFSFHSSIAQTEISGFYRFGQLNAGMTNPWFSSKESNLGMNLKYHFLKKIALQISFDKQLISENGINIIYLNKNQWYLSSSHFVYVNLRNDLVPIYDNYYTSRFNFTHQFHIKKQFSERIHLKFSPTLVHFNLVSQKEIVHDQFYLGLEFTKRLGKKSYVLIEYFFPIQQYLKESSNFLKIAYVFPIYNSKLEFSLSNHLSNYVTENSALTNQKWNEGAINLGIQYLYFFNKKS